MSRFAAMGLFAFLWAGAAAIALWRSSPPGGAAFMFWTGIVVAAGAGYWVAQIRRLQARRRLYLLLAIVCLGLPFGLAAVFG
jgi:hypothetical protein